MNAYRLPGASPDILVVAFGERIFGMHPTTGERLWMHADFDSNAVSATRLFVEGETVLCGMGRALTSLAYRTGKVIWRVETKIPVDTMLVGPTTITIGWAGQVAAYDRQGQLLWHDAFKGCGQGAVALGFPDNVANADLDR